MTLNFIHCICSIGHGAKVEALKYHFILCECSCNKEEVLYKAAKKIPTRLEEKNFFFFLKEQIMS